MPRRPALSSGPAGRSAAPRRWRAPAGALGLLVLAAWLVMREHPRASVRAEPVVPAPAEETPPTHTEGGPSSPPEPAGRRDRRESGEAPPGAREVGPAETGTGAPTAFAMVCVERDGDPVSEVEVRDGRPSREQSGYDPLADPQGLGFVQVGRETGLGRLFDFDPPSRSTVWTDAAGCAAVAPLEPGERAFWLRPPGGTWLRVAAELDPGPNRIEVALGTAAVSGHVHADDGTPAGAQLLTLLQSPSPERSEVWRQTFTDLDGAYAFADLAGGDAWTYRITPPPFLLEQGAPFMLATGEQRVQDFGSQRGLGRLSATVRLASGRDLDVPQHLFLRCGPGIRLGTLTRTGFTMELPLGTYVIRLGATDGPVVGEVELDGDLHCDLVVPGIAVCGALEYVGAKHPFARGPETEVVLELLDALGHPTGARVLRGERRYTFLGLSPGSYALATSPWPIEGTDGRLPIVVEAGVTEVVVDLRITDP